MMNKSQSLQRLRQRLMALYRAAHNPKDRRTIQQLIEELDSGVAEYEDLLYQAHNIGARNPAYLGDQVG